MPSRSCSQQNVPLLQLVNAAAQTNTRIGFPMLMPPHGGMPRWPPNTPAAAAAAAPPLLHPTASAPGPSQNLFLQHVYNAQLPPRLQYPHAAVNCEFFFYGSIV